MEGAAVYVVYHIDFGHDNSYVTGFYYKSIEKLPFTGLLL